LIALLSGRIGGNAQVTEALRSVQRHQVPADQGHGRIGGGPPTSAAPSPPSWTGPGPGAPGADGGASAGCTGIEEHQWRQDPL